MSPQRPLEYSLSLLFYIHLFKLNICLFDRQVAQCILVGVASVAYQCTGNVIGLTINSKKEE